MTLRHTVRGGDYERQPGGSVRVTIKEDDESGIVVDAADLLSALPIMEGETDTYTVKLASQPTGVVTVMVNGASGDITVNPSRLVFTTSNWRVSQTVEVKVGQDADGDDDDPVRLTHAASGGGYNLQGVGELTVTSEDDDDKLVIVTPRSLTVTEGSAANSYSVVLNTEPMGTVTIAVDVGTAMDESLLVSPTSLTFTQRNWNIPQFVTVRAAEDDDGTANPVTLMHRVTGGGYSTVMARDVIVTIRENDTVGLAVTPTRLEITQGSRRTYTVALNTKPAAGVVVTIAAAGTGVTASPTSLTFTTSNWSRPRTVTVHAAPTATAAESNITNTAANAVSGDDSGYDTQAVTAVVEVKDANTAGVAVNPNELSITEGGSASYTMVLTRAPSASVSVDIEISGSSGDVTLNRSRVTFSTSNWNRDQTVTVRVAKDEDGAADAPVTLTHDVTSADSAYEALGSTDVTGVTVRPLENDTPGVTVAPTSLTIAAGVTGTYRVRLNTEPTGDVTIDVNSPRADVTAVSGSTLLFTPQNWDSEQTVTVMVDGNAGDDEPQSVTLTHSVSGGDYGGRVVASDVTVTIPVEGTPSAPRGLTVTVGNQQVTLSWSAPASDGGSAIARYQVRYEQSGGNFTEWADVSGGASASSHTVTGLENGTSYTFEVRAMNAVGGGQGATVSATLSESVPGAPANLTATAGDGQVALTWGESAGGGSQILRYEYRYAASGETWSEWMTATGAGNARGVTIDGLTNGTLYGFEVRAVNSIGEGEASQATATPGRAPSAPTGLTARVESETITVMWGMPADIGGAAITRYEVRYRNER